METGAGAFYWADKIEARGAQCFIIDPYRFRIIKDSEEQDGQAGFEEYVQSTVGIYGYWRVWTSSGVQALGSDSRASRELTRTILTQSLIQVTDASPYFRNYYDELKDRRGAGRSRIALIQKLCGIMRRMLLDGKAFKYAEVTLYTRKQKQYERALNQIREERESA